MTMMKEKKASDFLFFLFTGGGERNEHIFAGRNVYGCVYMYVG